MGVVGVPLVWRRDINCCAQITLCDGVFECVQFRVVLPCDRRFTMAPERGASKLPHF